MDVSIIGFFSTALTNLNQALHTEQIIKEQYATSCSLLNEVNQVNIGIYGLGWMDENAFSVPLLPEDVVYDSTELEEMINSGQIPEMSELSRITAEITQSISNHTQWIHQSTLIMNISVNAVQVNTKDLTNNLVVTYTRNWQVKHTFYTQRTQIFNCKYLLLFLLYTLKWCVIFLVFYF